ncbi:hypothetical protein TNCV_1655161 [Trichonephila clavipes]|nr:hypothetical protein TNCV_1655161 [Trichonephila clavipes]
MNDDKKLNRLPQVKKKGRKRVYPKNNRNEGQDKFREQNTSDYFMLREYFLLFGLLRLIGINVVENAENKTNKNSQDHKTRNIKERETKLPVRLINTKNERRLVQGHGTTPLGMKRVVEDISSELDNGVKDCTS